MPESYPHLRRNLIAFGCDTIFFGIGLSGFLNASVILPAFTARLGGSTIIVGLVLTLINLAWSFPQFMAGNLIGRFKKKKPIVVTMALSGRLFVPAFALLLSVTGGEPPTLIFVALCAALMIFLGTYGFATIGWLDMLGRAFPPHKRGSYIAIWQAIASLGVMGVSLLVGVVLADDGPRFPQNYVIVFGLASVLFMMSLLSTMSIYEPRVVEEAAQTAHVPWRDLASHLLELWRNDARLRHLAEARVIFSFAMMAFPFFVLFATQRLGLPNEMLGSFITAQTIGTMFAGLALGRVADRFGAQRAIQIGAAILVTVPIIGLVMSTIAGWPVNALIAVYIWIYICSGLANNILFLGFGNYLLDISPPGNRTIYIGAFNAINSVGVIAPLLAGWLVAAASYSVLFVVTLGFCLIALVIVARLPHPRQVEVGL